MRAARVAAAAFLVLRATCFPAFVAFRFALVVAAYSPAERLAIALEGM